MSDVVKLTKKDFESGQEVRWCPGCGDYSILATVQRLLPSLDVPKEKHVFISGIGCSSRFPYYMNTYGFHTIHGRAPGLATGLKVSNPDLCVWIITGDGDALSIGGNHLMHILRRNVNVNILMFNNKIYGLTKGQYSPTSEQGKVTKSTPYGSIDYPANPLSLALGCGASFVARGLDVDAKGLTDVLSQAAAHQGTSFVEIFQNCNVFNDGAHSYMSERPVRKEKQVWLSNGKQAIFGSEDDKGLKLNGLAMEVSSDTEAMTYDTSNLSLAKIIADLPQPEFPVPMGIIYQEDRATYDDAVHEQIAEAKKSPKDLQSVIAGSENWKVA